MYFLVMHGDHALYYTQCKQLIIIEKEIGHNVNKVQNQMLFL